MSSLARRFLSDSERRQIEASVREAETTTSGEIVPMVVSSSYHYPTASMIGALIVSLLAAGAVTAAFSIRQAWEGFGLFDLWIFPAVFAVAFLLSHELIRRVPGIKRLFVTSAEIREEVEEAALTSFYRQRLNNTRDRTGILVFVSVFERRAVVLADEGINAQVPQETWQEVVDTITRGIRQNRQAEALCQAISRCGELVRDKFPRRRDDTDELRNLIVVD
jgi:putative membrane protein